MTTHIPHPATEPMTTTGEEPMQLSRDEIETIRDSLYNGHILDVRTDCFESLCDMALSSLDPSPPAADVREMVEWLDGYIKWVEESEYEIEPMWKQIRNHLATPASVPGKTAEEWITLLLQRSIGYRCVDIRNFEDTEKFIRAIQADAIASVKPPDSL